MAPKRGKKKGKGDGGKAADLIGSAAVPKPTKPPPPPKCFNDDMLAMLKEEFLKYDEAEIKKIAKVHLPVLMRNLGFNPTKEELGTLLTDFLADPLADLIELHEFYFMVEAKMNWGDAFEWDVQEAFKAFDHDELGYVHIDYLKEVLQEWGEPLTDAEFNDFPRIAHREGLLPEGRLAYDLFVEKLNKKDRRFMPEPINYWKLDQKTLLEMARQRAKEEAAEAERLEEIRIAKEAARRARDIAEGRITVEEPADNNN